MSRLDVFQVARLLASFPTVINKWLVLHKSLYIRLTRGRKGTDQTLDGGGVMDDIHITSRSMERKKECQGSILSPAHLF